MSPFESRKATRSSPSRRRRTGGQSALGNSSASIAGSQNRRNSSPMGVPGPTRHANSLSSLLNTAPPLRLNLTHLTGDLSLNPEHAFDFLAAKGFRAGTPLQSISTLTPFFAHSSAYIRRIESSSS